ncbi:MULTISPECIES: response regulator transcription factor [Acidovorax]|uniref:Response regulator transcription factor n=1 Tax=Acidovorax facilis TaxID=12917 RepID=A0ABV8D5H0_9BURK|nr:MULTISPECIES: response regulator [Acidovorax]KQB60186.1 LuxR family transcriptional regulator [Acidovorax sp. SD340]MBO1007340.1 response regulator transcription factor [Acidovorax sp. SD340]MCO4243210.1 response regulator [Acidovorax facilis]RKR65615.1 LuxR family two component transcriptional regulator [Acidovorax sp. 94]
MTDSHPTTPVTVNTTVPANVYVVDDDEGVRNSLAALLLAGGHAPRTFASGPEFLARADLAHPGCVLLDLRMDGMSGLQVFDALRERNAVLKTVFLSAHGELASAVTAVKQGAVDWLEKPCDEQTLLAAVLRAANLSLEDAQRAQRRNTLRERWNTLSPRQQEVARLLATGISSKEVARALAQRDPERPIDPRTVDTHRSAIFLKLDIRSSHELGMLVEDLGLAENTLRTL